MPILSLSVQILYKSLRQGKDLYFGLDFQGSTEKFWLHQITCEKRYKPTPGTCGKHRHNWHGAAAQKQQLQSNLPAGCRRKAEPSAHERVSRAVWHRYQPRDKRLHRTQPSSNTHLRQPLWGHLTAQDHVLHHIFSVFKTAKKI